MQKGLDSQEERQEERTCYSRAETCSQDLVVWDASVARLTLRTYLQ
jgi:hypothetical protein